MLLDLLLEGLLLVLRYYLLPLLLHLHGGDAENHENIFLMCLVVFLT